MNLQERICLNEKDGFKNMESIMTSEKFRVKMKGFKAC